MVKIQQIALTKLLKLELPQFVKQVTKCLEKHNLEVLKLKDTYELLKEQRSKMALLKVSYGKHPLTKKIHQLHLKRIKYAAAITSQMIFLSKMDAEDTRSLVQLAHPMVKIHLYYLRQNNRFEIDQIITIFFKQLNEKPEVLNALEALGLKYYLDELKRANDEHYKLSNERTSDISQRPKIDTLAVQREAHYVLRGLFEQINFYQFTYRDIDYSKMIGEINGLITRFSGLIHIRETCNKTRKAKASAEETKVKPADLESNVESKTFEASIENTLNDNELNNKKSSPPFANKVAPYSVSHQNLLPISPLPDGGSL